MGEVFQRTANGIDLFVLNETDDPTRFTWTPVHGVLTPGGTVQGGAALGAAVEAMERVTGRPTVWATAQYLSFAVGVAPIDIDVTVEVAGRNTAQVRCVLARDGREILTAHAALGRRDLEVGGVWRRFPDVPEPDECPRYRFFESGCNHLGDLVDLRLATGRQLDEIATTEARGDGSFTLWARAWDEPSHLVTSADLAFIGDFMPLGYAEALGQPFAGNSLDNTVRVGELTRTGWVLVSCQVQQIIHGFGYGHAELWAQDGTLLGAVNQSSIMRDHRHIRAARDRAAKEHADADRSAVRYSLT